MNLIQFDGSGATVRLYPGDCARLAELLGIAEAKLVTIEETPKSEAAQTYAALFRALTLGGLTPGFLLADSHKMIGEELAALGLGDLLAPRPSGKQKEATQ